VGACASDRRPNLSGYVGLESTETYGSTSVLFRTEEPSNPPTVSTVGPCVISEGQFLRVDAAVDANTITITGTHPDVMLVPDMYSHYTDYSQQTPLFSGNEALTITANGGEVPAFTGHLNAPSKAVMTAPVPANTQLGEFLEVPSTQDLVITWTGGSGSMQILAAAAATTVQCLFPASDGTGTIPHAVLAALSGPLATFDFASVDQDEVIAGDWHVTITAAFPAVWPDGTSAVLSVDVE
jgi:hypothetical protein